VRAEEVLKKIWLTESRFLLGRYAQLEGYRVALQRAFVGVTNQRHFMIELYPKLGPSTVYPLTALLCNGLLIQGSKAPSKSLENITDSTFVCKLRLSNPHFLFRSHHEPFSNIILISTSNLITRLIKSHIETITSNPTSFYYKQRKHIS
jgi:hypothetical protein